MDHDTAVEFEKRIGLVFQQMDKASEFLRSRLDRSDFRTFADAWGEIVCELDLGILEVIYRAHPDLRPDGMISVAPLGAGCRLYAPKPDADRDEPRPTENNGPP